MLGGRHALEIDVDGVVVGNVRAAPHAPPARTDLRPSTTRLRLGQHEKVAAFGSGFRFLRYGGSGGGGGGRAVAAVAEVEDGEVESLTASDADAQRRALGGAAGQPSGVVRLSLIHI